jgi:hypothetical protein
LEDGLRRIVMAALQMMAVQGSLLQLVARGRSSSRKTKHRQGCGRRLFFRCPFRCRSSASALLESPKIHGASTFKAQPALPQKWPITGRQFQPHLQFRIASSSALSTSHPRSILITRQTQLHTSDNVYPKAPVRSKHSHIPRVAPTQTRSDRRSVNRLRPAIDMQD